MVLSGGMWWLRMYQAPIASAASNPPEKTPPACSVLTLKISRQLLA